MTTTVKAVVAGVSAVVLAFLAGRYSRPAVVVHDEKKTTVDTRVSDHLAVAEQEVAALKSDLATWQARAVTAEAHTDVITKWRYLPGKVIEITREAKTDSRSAENDTVGSKATSAATKQLSTNATGDHAEATRTQIVEVHTETPKKSSWGISLMPGYQWHGTPFVDAKGPLVIGASVEHRFIGPVSLGAWGSTSGAAGVTLRAEF